MHDGTQQMPGPAAPDRAFFCSTPPRHKLARCGELFLPRLVVLCTGACSLPHDLLILLNQTSLSVPTLAARLEKLLTYLRGTGRLIHRARAARDHQKSMGAAPPAGAASSVGGGGGANASKRGLLHLVTLSAIDNSPTPSPTDPWNASEWYPQQLPNTRLHTRVDI